MHLGLQHLNTIKYELSGPCDLKIDDLEAYLYKVPGNLELA